MGGWWREFYSLMGWDYYDAWEPRQRQLKYKVCQQIEKSKLKLKPTTDIQKDEVIKDVPRNKKVRFSQEPQQVPQSRPNSPSELYDSPQHQEECIQELRTLFKQSRKNRWNDKRSWRRGGKQ